MGDIYSDKGSFLTIQVPGNGETVVKATGATADDITIFYRDPKGVLTEYSAEKFYLKLNGVGNTLNRASEIEDFKNAIAKQLVAIKENSHNRGDFLDAANLGNEEGYYIYNALKGGIFEAAGGLKDGQSTTRVSFEYKTPTLDPATKKPIGDVEGAIVLKRNDNTDKIEIEEAGSGDFKKLAFAERHKGKREIISGLQYTAGNDANVVQDKTSGDPRVVITHNKRRGGQIHVADMAMDAEIVVGAPLIVRDVETNRHKVSIKVAGGEPVHAELVRRGTGANAKFVLSDNYAKESVLRSESINITVADVINDAEVQRSLATALKKLTPTEDIKKVSEAINAVTKPLDIGKKDAILVIEDTDLAKNFRFSKDNSELLAIYRDEKSGKVYASKGRRIRGDEQKVKLEQPIELSEYVENLVSGFSANEQDAKREEFFKLIDKHIGASSTLPIVTMNSIGVTGKEFITAMKAAGNDDKARNGVIRDHGDIKTATSEFGTHKAPVKSENANVQVDPAVIEQKRANDIAERRLEWEMQQQGQKVGSPDRTPAPTQRTEQQQDQTVLPPAGPTGNQQQQTTQRRNGDAQTFAGGNNPLAARITKNTLIGGIGFAHSVNAGILTEGIAQLFTLMGVDILDSVMKLFRPNVPPPGQAQARG